MKSILLMVAALVLGSVAVYLLSRNSSEFDSKAVVKDTVIAPKRIIHRQVDKGDRSTVSLSEGKGRSSVDNPSAADRTPLSSPRVDPAISHLKKLLERVPGDEEQKGKVQEFIDAFEVKSSFFARRYNRVGLALTHEDERNIRDIVAGQASQIVAVSSACDFEQYAASLRMVKERRFVVAKPTDMEQTLRDAKKRARDGLVFVLPGTDPSENRILVFSRDSHPRLADLLDEKSRLEKQLDMKIAAYIKAHPQYSKKVTEIMAKRNSRK